jgi:hypothetical protein
MGETVKVAGKSGVFLPASADNIRSIDSIDTIQNDLGLVDICATVAALQKVSGSREWRKWSDIHHIYWPERCYPKKTFYKEFRELPINKVALPRDFHEFLHRTSEPPAIPEEDIMHYQVVSHDSAKVMFESAQIIIRRQREIDRFLGKRPGRESLSGGIKSRKKAISNNKQRFDYARDVYSSVPSEARALSVDLDAGLEVVARQLGRFVMKPIRNFSELQTA